MLAPIQSEGGFTVANGRDLDGQLAIVTGAGRGIGRAIALELARLGADIVVAELNLESALRTASEVEQVGRRAVGVGVDVTRAEDRQAMIDRTLSIFGRIDILINNAGIYRAGTPLDITEEHWDKVLSVNARAVFFCAQAVLPTMLAARRGVIVNVASMAGKIATTNGLPYAVSKAAVISLTRSLALTYARDGIRVNCVCPGLVDTDMFAQLDRDIGVDQLGKQPGEYTRERFATIPIGRAEQPEDVAGVVGFLASSTSAYMTGQAINVTGGLLFH
jgi:NAD(P)-dependent dehydrogenase (short-subunit alcohol dehydrogenase family)